MAFDHAKTRAEFNALPDWAKSLILAAQKSSGCGSGSDDLDRFNVFMNFENRDEAGTFFSALLDLKEFADDLSAPDPSFYEQLPPEQELTADNLVETFMDDEDSAFDQPCRFGHRVGGHSVYCHNSHWPNAPRKCHRSWYTGGEFKDEDCAGYAPNPNRKST
mgnify:FL=1